MRIIYYLLIVVFFTSCLNTKQTVKDKELSNGAQNIKNIGIVYSFEEKRDQYINFYDSTINEFMTDFNKQNHLFKINLLQPNDSFAISIQFIKTRFATQGTITTSYILTGLGLIALPMVTYNSSNGKFIAFGWYLPRDISEFEFKQSKYLRLYSNRLGYRLIKSGATFSTEKKREQNIKNAFYNQLKRYFEGIEIDIKMKIKK